MFHRTGDAAPAPVKAEPSSLLKLVAGDFAPLVARIWPTPHVEFVTASAARRHLVCLAFALGRDVAALRERLLGARLKAAIPAALGRPAPAGLARALARMGEVAWGAEDYRVLLRLLADPKAAKVLWHAESVQAEAVRSLGRMPPAMGEGAALALQLGPDGVAVVREAWEALRFRDGEAAAARAAGRWARTGSLKALVEAVKDDLYPEPEAPPHPGTARLKPLASKAALRTAGRRYRNCLREQTPYAASGWSAFYEWVGPPGAVVEVSRDAVFGWRLEQARLAGNEPVPEPLRWEIVAELALMGVHVGRSSWELDRALADIGRAHPLRPAMEAVNDAFGE